MFKTLLAGFGGSKVLFSSGNRKPHRPSHKSTGSLETEVVVKILGTAQDGGIPFFGCYCTNCLRARKDPQLSRLISSLAIFDLKEEIFFLIDATPDIRVQIDMARKRLKHKKTATKFALGGVLLTHAHIGHYTGLMFFGYEAASSHRLPVYCSKQMENFLSNNGPWSQLVSLENIAVHTLAPERSHSLTSNISIVPFPVPHRDEYTDTLGFLISGTKRKLLYIPDIQSWEAWRRPVVEEIKKVDIALLDGTFFSSEELLSRDLSNIGHPFIQHSLDILKSVVRKAKTKVYFTHLNHTNLALDPASEARRKVEEEGFHLASDGMEFYL